MTSIGKAQLPAPPSSELLFERFDVIAELGSGGSGRVRLCKDRESGETVAIKQLHCFGADALLRFKNEYRVLADVQHANVVRLGELFEGAGSWAFSLEYVPGTDALSWVRSDQHESGLHETRLRTLLAELVHGLMAIHALGILHRDVKPANVRVTPEGRVVILDFGVVTRLGPASQSSDGRAVGSVAYMAPEQARADLLTPAADFYALGVLLYEALTGQLPFDGEPLEVMQAKQRRLPVAPRAIAVGIPQDLDLLCMHLLQIRPENRPDGQTLLTVLAAQRATESKQVPSSAASMLPTREELFVGRGTELAALRQSWESALQQGMRVVLLEGESGIGKSALAVKLAHSLAAANSKVLVLSGRCHASEQVAYKAFDGVVDELSNHLKALSHQLAQRCCLSMRTCYPSCFRCSTVCPPSRRPDSRPKQKRSNVIPSSRPSWSCCYTWAERDRSSWSWTI